MMVVVMMVIIITTISGYHDDARPISLIAIPLIAISPIIAVVMMVMVILRQLDIFIGRRSGPGFIDGLQQRRGIRNRLKQIGE